MPRRNVILSVTLLFVFSAVQMRGQNQALVIEGGTLIDGSGGAAMRDAVIVIQGPRISAVGTKGTASIPSNAKVIRADGKNDSTGSGRFAHA